MARYVKPPKFFLALAFMLLTIPAWACDSYEECMACINQDVFADSVRCTSGSQLDIHKAIAYKLDEISRKLDNSGQEEGLCSNKDLDGKRFSFPCPERLKPAPNLK